LCNFFNNATLNHIRVNVSHTPCESQNEVRSRETPDQDHDLEQQCEGYLNLFLREFGIHLDHCEDIERVPINLFPKCSIGALPETYGYFPHTFALYLFVFRQMGGWIRWRLPWCLVFTILEALWFWTLHRYKVFYSYFPWPPRKPPDPWILTMVGLCLLDPSAIDPVSLYAWFPWDMPIGHLVTQRVLKKESWVWY